VIKKLSLRPYHGEVWVCFSPEEMKRAYRRLTRQLCPHEIREDGGRFIKIEFDDHRDTKWLVYAKTPHYLAHELTHVLLKTFGFIGHNPTQGDGEPFCYMLSQLMLEASE
jgi:hypothetical protein